MSSLTVLADGLDLTGYVDLSQMSGQNDLTQRLDTLSLRLVQAPLDAIDDKMDVVVFDQTGTRWFGGIVGHIARASTSPERAWDVDVQGYAALLDTALANRVYNGQTDVAILADLLGAYRPEISLLPLAAPTVLDHIAFPYKALSRCIDTICAHTGCRYYVDPNQVLTYFNPQSLRSVLALTDQGPDGASSYSYERWSLHSDATQIQNRVLAIGGTALAPNLTETFTGDGSTATFTLAHRPHKTSSVVVGSTAYAFGHDGIDQFGAGSPPIAALINDADQALRLQSAPLAGHSVQIVYDYMTPIIVRAQSNDSYAQYGRWYDGAPIRDSTMLSVQTAIARATTVLAQYAFAPRQVTLRTRAPWTRSGQAVALTNTPDGVNNEQFLIQQTRWRPLGGGVVVQDLQLIG